MRKNIHRGVTNVSSAPEHNTLVSRSILMLLHHIKHSSFCRYDPKENKWSKVSPMTTRRLGVAVAVLGGYLYAIGGSDGQSPLNTVERYDPRQNKWTQVSPMSTRRKHLGCAVFNNLIYAVGGRDDCMELSSAERYNPHTNSWSPIVAMTSRRSGVSSTECFYRDCCSRFQKESCIERIRCSPRR